MQNNSTLICNNNCCYSLDYSGNIWSCGSSPCKQNGFTKNLTHFKQISSLVNVKMISCGKYHLICMNYEGEVFSIGRNNSGQLGIGKNKNELPHTHIPQKVNLPTCKQISCGDNFTVCVIDEGYLYSFGTNSTGQLGIGSNNLVISSPIKIVDLDNVDFIICGALHVLCKTYDSEYYSWGSNTSGQLGHGNNQNCNKPIKNLNWPNDIISMKCGLYHSLLLTLDGKVYSFGSNTNGQLALANSRKVNIPTLIKNIPEITRIECGSYFNLFIDIDNNLLVSGSNYYSQLGLEGQGNHYKVIKNEFFDNVIDISSGGRSTFVKTLDNKIYAFGYNEHSQLGIITSIRQKPIQVFQDNDIWCSNLGKSRQKSARK